MKINLTQSLGLIQIGLTDIGSYLKFKRPISVEWQDCAGSIGKFMCLMPYNEEYRQEVSERINNNIFNDYSENLPGLYDDFEPLFRLFENGEYFIHFGNIKEQGWYLIFPKITDNKLSNSLFWGNQSDLLNSTTSCNYDRQNSYLIATEPKEKINQERVDFYEKEIKSGQRPFAIEIYKGYMGGICNNDWYNNEYHSWQSESFILDGHHKLLAYHRLNIQPPMLSICQGFSAPDDLKFDLTMLKEYMYPWQIKHIQENSEDIQRLTQANKH